MESTSVLPLLPMCWLRKGSGRCSSHGCQAALAPTSPSPLFEIHSSVEKQRCQGP